MLASNKASPLGFKDFYAESEKFIATKHLENIYFFKVEKELIPLTFFG